MRAIAQAERDCAEIKAGRAVFEPATRSLIVVSPTTDSLDDLPLHSPMVLARANEDAALLRKEINVAKAIMLADDILQENTSDPPVEQVDLDWLSKWRGGVGDVSSDDVRQLWARILAGEIKEPGTFSLRTLHVLSLLTSRDADLITRLMSLSVNGALFEHDELHEVGLSFDECLTLESMGLLIGVQSLTMVHAVPSVESEKYFAVLNASGRALILHQTDSKAEFTYKAYTLTQSGLELYKLGAFETPEVYLHRLAHHAMTQGFTVEIAQSVVKDDGHLALLDIRPVPPPPPSVEVSEAAK